MNWVFLCLAILFEVAGTVSMKLSSGFTKLAFGTFASSSEVRAS